MAPNNKSMTLKTRIWSILTLNRKTWIEQKLVRPFKFISSLGIDKAALGRENAFEGQAVDRRGEPILTQKAKNRTGELHTRSGAKKRIFSSAGGRRHKLLHNKNRVQTAKYFNRGGPRATHNRWKGGSNLNMNKKKGKRHIKVGKKKIPLGEYAWPESHGNFQNNQRPITASHGENPRGGRRPQNYDVMRRKIQSRGKANPTDLSGTSQSSNVQDGNSIRFIYF